MAKILVTGGAGFIGSHLVDKLIEKGYQVVVIDNLSTGKKENLNPKAKFYQADICDPKISEIFQKEKPEIVFHFAAQIDVRKSVENPIDDANINILGSLNLIQNFIRTSISWSNSNNSNIQASPTFIFASSGGAIYGEADIIPTPETHPENPESPYGIAKLTIEKYLHFYKKTYGLNYISLRFSNIYGPRQNSKGEAGIVAIFTDKILDNKSPTIFGTGDQTRDFLFVKDAVTAAILALNAELPQDVSPIFNVGTGVETSINQIFKLLTKEIKKDIKPKYAPAKKGDLMRSCLDISKIKKVFSWQPKYKLKEGLRETINWLKN
jgi:UDP-glucose 4-epimerase